MRLPGVILVMLLAAAQPPAAADWLVTRDGDQIETVGPWHVEDRGVVYTSRRDNTFSVLREKDVDLVASRALTERGGPAAPAAKAEVAPRKRGLVLTNEDVAVAEDDEADDLGTEPEPEADAPAVQGPVEVVSWDTLERQEGGLEIRGMLRNSGTATAGDIRVEVTARDAAGQTFTSRAFLEVSALGMGQSTSFRALFPDVLSLEGDPSFSVRSESFSILAPARAAESEG